MSRKLEIALEESMKSTFRFLPNSVIEVNDAAILWPDFTGKITKFNTKLGEHRSINLVLNPDMMNELANLEAKTNAKFKIRYVDVYTEDDVKVKGVQQVTIPYINIKVNMKAQVPPVIVLHTTYNGKRKRTVLTEDTISQLDSADLTSVCLQFRCYSSPAHEGCLTGYLNKYYAIQAEQQPEFGGKFDDWDDTNEEPLNEATGEMVDPML